MVKGQLPEYMMPAAWVEMPSLPLTPNGKVDRKNLPAPEYQRAELAGEYQEARTPAEEVMAGIWAEVLKLDRVGVTDDQFFELGGHSLLATQVVSRIRHAFQVELPLRALFEAPTVAELAERVERMQREQQGLLAPPIVPVPRTAPPAAVVRPAAAVVPGSAGAQQLELQRSARGPDDGSTCEPEVLEAKPATKSCGGTRRCAPRSRWWTTDAVQVIAPELNLPLAIEDLTSLPEAGREDGSPAAGAEEAQRPFDLIGRPAHAGNSADDWRKTITSCS